MPSYRPNVTTWRTGLPLNTLVAIPNTSGLGGVTANAGTVNAWCGPAAAPKAWYFFAAGGHGDSGENKIIRVSLDGVTITFTALDPGSASATPATVFYYGDGRPASRHNYYCAQYIASRDRVMSFGAFAANVDPISGPNVDGFAFSANAYDAAGTWPDCPHSHLAQAVARDPRTDDVWISSDGVFNKWTAATNTWSTPTVTGSPGTWEFKPACVDPLRNSLVHLNAQLRVVDMATLVCATNTITGAYAGAVTADYDPLTYDTDSDRYLTINGTTLYAINPVTFGSTALTSVPSPGVGALTRLAFFPNLHCAMYMPDFASNIYCYPTR